MSLIDERIEYEDQSNSSPMPKKFITPNKELETAITFNLKIQDPCDVGVIPFDINKNNEDEGKFSFKGTML